VKTRAAESKRSQNVIEAHADVDELLAKEQDGGGVEADPFRYPEHGHCICKWVPISGARLATNRECDEPQGSIVTRLVGTNGTTEYA
jgi:hypothetical protein